jgi:hypothetical protein
MLLLLAFSDFDFRFVGFLCSLHKNKLFFVTMSRRFVVLVTLLRGFVTLLRASVTSR